MFDLALQKISRIIVRPINLLLGLRLWKFNVCLSLTLGMAIAPVLPAIAGMKIEGLHKGKGGIVEVEPSDRNERSRSPLADGTYVFGRSPEAGQYGVTYVVFEVEGGRVDGAFYEVDSEYSCFIGTVENQNLNLSVEDLDGTSYPYAIALEDRGTIATSHGLMRVVGLQGYHQLEELSNLDRNLLQSCRTH